MNIMNIRQEDFVSEGRERDVPEAAYFGPVARRVKGPKSAASGATRAERV